MFSKPHLQQLIAIFFFAIASYEFKNNDELFIFNFGLGIIAVSYLIINAINNIVETLKKMKENADKNQNDTDFI